MVVSPATRSGSVPLLLAPGKDPQTEGVQPDEAGGVLVVVGVRTLEAGDGVVVEAVLGTASGDVAGALEELDPDFAGDELLALGDHHLKHLPLGCKPETVVNHVGVAGDQAVAQMHDFAVEGDLLQSAVGVVEDGSGGGLIDAPGLHAHEAVLDDVHPSHGVLAADGVEFPHDVGGGEGFAVDLDGDALLEGDDDVFGGVRRFGEGIGHDRDVLGEFVPRILKDAALEADVQEVAVHAVGLLGGDADGDVVGLGVFDHVEAPGELPLGITPRGDDLHVGIDGVGVQLETDLIVALAGGSVADGVGLLGLGDFHEALGDEGTGDGSAQKVVVLVDGSALKHGEDEIPGELFIEVIDDALAGAGGDGFGLETVEFFLLPHVGAVADDFRVVGFLDPLDDDRGVQTAGVSDDYFHLRILPIFLVFLWRDGFQSARSDIILRYNILPNAAFGKRQRENLPDMDLFEQLLAAARRDRNAMRGVTPELLNELERSFAKGGAPAVAAQTPAQAPVPREKVPNATAFASAPAPAPIPAPAPASVPAPKPQGGQTFVPPRAAVGATLEELSETVKTCALCELGKHRQNAVFGEGDPHAELMFIGEGPGADEDRQGRPFVGSAGQLLDKMISAMQFRREEVYIANVVKCRPPDNRTPTPEEACHCVGYLVRQIELVQPKVIVLLGATAAHFLLDRPEGITRLRGRWLEYRGIPVMPTYHPAYLLRQESAKRDAWHDLQLVMAKFGKSYR